MLMDPAVISKACGAPFPAVASSWPVLEAEMDRLGMGDRLPLIACAATVRVE